MARTIIPFEYYPKSSGEKTSPLKASGKAKTSPLKSTAVAGSDLEFYELLNAAGGTGLKGLTSSLDAMKSQFAQMDTSNLWKNYQNQYRDIENVYEDVTVPTEAYDLKKRQREQGLATSIQAMRESGMGAGSVQMLSNAAVRGAAEDTAQISQQLYKNELLKAGEESRLETLERKGADEAQRLRVQGAVDSRNLQFQVKQGLMSLTAGEIASIREADAYRSANRGGGGASIICTELHRQGYLNEDIYEADERFGNMVYEKDPKLMFGYHLWAVYIVDFMKKYPETAKYVYLLAKPWAEHMACIMGDDSKKTIIGKAIHWVGVQFSYYIADKAIKKNKMFNVFKK